MSITDGKVLHKFVKSHDQTKEQLAEQIGVSVSAFNFWYTQAELPKTALEKLAQIGFDIKKERNKYSTNKQNIEDDLIPKKKEHGTSTNDAQKENELLREMLRLKEEVIRAKEETIQALRNQTSKVEDLPATPINPIDLLSNEYIRKINKHLDGDMYDCSMCVSDSRGLIEDVNEQFTKQTGYTLSDVRGKKAGDVLQRNDADKNVKKRMRDAILDRTYYEGEVLNYSKKGEPILCRLIIAPIKIKGIAKLISLAVFSKVNALKYT